MRSLWHRIPPRLRPYAIAFGAGFVFGIPRLDVSLIIGVSFAVVLAMARGAWRLFVLWTRIAPTLDPVLRPRVPAGPMHAMPTVSQTTHAPRKQKCSHCSGDGEIFPCTRCEGLGHIYPDGLTKVTCELCQGNTRMTCRPCGATGYVYE